MPIKAERESSGAPECQLGKSKVSASPLAEIFYFSGPIRKANAFLSAIRVNPINPWLKKFLFSPCHPLSFPQASCAFHSPLFTFHFSLFTMYCRRDFTGIFLI